MAAMHRVGNQPKLLRCGQLKRGNSDFPGWQTNAFILAQTVSWENVADTRSQKQRSFRRGYQAESNIAQRLTMFCLLC